MKINELNQQQIHALNSVIDKLPKNKSFGFSGLFGYPRTVNNGDVFTLRELLLEDEFAKETLHSEGNEQCIALTVKGNLLKDSGSVEQYLKNEHKKKRILIWNKIEKKSNFILTFIAAVTGTVSVIVVVWPDTLNWFRSLF